MPVLTNAEKLAEAVDALHALNLGRSARVFVDQNGERVEYTAANRGALRAYIAELEVKVSLEKGIAAPAVGPLRAFF